ncbi:MAG: MarR family winged helix-turn-helix transcriptional regulator [Henriciella sp.]|nr:MarR family winged helix-turn-helix transcriptional regulator [Henriciella sp.]
MSTDTDVRLDDFFSGCLFFSVSRLQRDLNRMAEAAFRPLGLAPSQAFLLMAVAERPDSLVGDLAEILSLAPSTITRFVDKLTAMELCERHGQGRQVQIRLTDKGQETLPAIHVGWKRLFASYNDAFGQDQAIRLTQMILKITRD